MNGWQVAARTLTAELWDVAIVGGGPAGTMAALHIARGGRRVVVLEQAEYPREKVCGDALIPDSIRVLDRANLLQSIEDRAQETTTLQLFSPSGIDVTIPTRALIIKRVEFDEILAVAAARAGATIANARVQEVEAGDAARLTIHGIATPIRARVAIIATGADTRLLAPLGILTRSKPTVLAVRRYLRSTARLDRLMFSFERTIAPGYAWVFPLRDGEFNVGCGTAYDHRRINLAAALDRFIYGFGPMRAISEGITEMAPLRGALLRCGLAGTVPLRPPNVLAIGESIGTTFPLTGEGIGKAMETGEVAASVVLRALDANNLSLLTAFPAALSILRSRYRGYEIAERWIARPWLADLVTLLLRRNRRAAVCAEAILNETADAREIFSARGLLKMLLS